jgi:hypothetical protein
MKIFKTRLHILKLYIVFLILFSSAAFSQQLEMFDGNGVPTMEALPKEQVDVSFLRKLRAEIQAEQIKEHHQSEKDGWYKSTNKRFIPESATFAIAGGGVYFLTMMAKTNSDPALMVKHLESLKDPIAHISFYSFMAANGMYINFKTKGMDPMTKQLAMKSLQYKGMAVGSLASSFTADLISTFSACTKGWVDNKNNEQSQAACDEAYKTWTLRNKFTQYAPQILSLIASQAGADMIDSSGRLVKGKWSAKAMQKTESAALKLFKVTSANIDLLITPGGVVVKSIAWIGKLTKFGLFLSVDHLLTPSVMRIGNNVLQPFFFQFDANKLDRLMKNGSDLGWSSEAANKPHIECAFQGCKSFDQLPQEIENFTYRMQQWRLHLNSKVENDLSGWLSETNKLLHQIEFSKNFYRTYLENLFSTMSRSAQIQKGEFKDEPKRAWSTQAIYPFRTLPLYGVSSGQDFKGEKENDLYLIKPWLLQKYQSGRLQQISVEYVNKIKDLKLDSISEKKFIEILTGLKSTSATEQGQQLIRLNNLLGIYSRELTAERAYLTNEFVAALKKLRKEIGNPLPIMDRGAAFSQAYMAKDTNQLTAQTAGFDLSRKQFSFNKASDLMFYNMICGSEKTEINEYVFSGLNFMPPRLIQENPDKLNFCSKYGTYMTTNSIYKVQIYDGQKSVLATDYLVSQLSPNILKDIEQGSESSNFEAWWNSTTIPAVQLKFKDLDTRYKTLVSEAYGNILDQKGYVDFTLDMYTHWSKRLDSNILDNMNFELEFYISTLDSILTHKKIATSDYIDSLIDKSKQEKFQLVILPKDLEKNNAILFRVLNIKKSYKNIIALLQNHEQIDFKKIEDLNIQLSQAIDGIYGKIKDYENVQELPTEVKLLFSVRKGLESLEIDLKRYLFLKVNLQNRLQIDTAQMNEFLKGQKPNKVHSGTKPQGGG